VSMLHQNRRKGTDSRAAWPFIIIHRRGIDARSEQEKKSEILWPEILAFFVVFVEMVITLRD
jgi:hypothetical protein